MKQMHYGLGVIALAVFVFGIAGCEPGQAGEQMANEQTASEESASVEDIDGARAQELVASGAHLIDVRTPAEFGDGHIDGARNIPVDVIAARAEEIGAMDEPVVLYCRSGRRSANAGETLIEMGFTEVYNLGGMNEW